MMRTVWAGKYNLKYLHSEMIILQFLQCSHMPTRKVHDVDVVSHTYLDSIKSFFFFLNRD